MEIFKIYNYLIWPMVALSLFGFFGCAAGLVKVVVSKAEDKPIRVPYLSLGALLIGLSFFVTSKSMIVSALNRYSLDSSITVQIKPSVAVNYYDFFKTIVGGLSKFKQSGSHPTERKWLMSVCGGESCISIEVARDSRDANLYWVAYKANGITLPLGYSSLAGKLNEI